MSSVEVPSLLMIFMIFLGDVILSALQSIPYGICAILISRIFKYGQNTVLSAFFSSALFAVTEHFQTFIEQTKFLGLIGFPWVVNYITQHKFLVGIQSASLFGAGFITIIIIFVNALLAYCIVAEYKKRIVCIVSAASVFSINIFYGVFALSFSSKHDYTITSVVYQDNNSSYSKWVTSSKDVCDEFIADMEEYFESGNNADIIVLSETVFTTSFGKDRANCSSSGRYIYDRLSDFSAKYDCAVIFGGFSEDDDGEHNSMFAIDKGVFCENVYHKRTLVPFGEYLPYENILLKLVPSLANFNLSGSFLSAGKESQIFNTETVKIGGIICYDSIFYYNTRKSVSEGAQIIALSTNDSWYNDSSAIYQHYAHSAFRAIETGRYLMRSATTGVSGILDNHGKTISQSKIFEKEIISADVQLLNGKTLFVRIGYSYLYALFGITIGYLVYKTIKTRRKKL